MRNAARAQHAGWARELQVSDEAHPPCMPRRGRQPPPAWPERAAKSVARSRGGFLLYRERSYYDPFYVDDKGNLQTETLRYRKCDGPFWHPLSNHHLLPRHPATGSDVPQSQPRLRASSKSMTLKRTRAVGSRTLSAAHRPNRAVYASMRTLPTSSASHARPMTLSSVHATSMASV